MHGFFNAKKKSNVMPRKKPRHVELLRSRQRRRLREKWWRT